MNVSKHRNTRIDGRITLFQGCSHILAFAYSFRNDNDTVSLTMIKVRLHPVSNLIQIVGYFRHENGLGSRSQTCMQGDISAVTSHNLYH
ncbi:hypothetical protein D3C85_1665650 [compost metagenome]